VHAASIPTGRQLWIYRVVNALSESILWTPAKRSACVRRTTGRDHSDHALQLKLGITETVR